VIVLIDDGVYIEADHIAYVAREVKSLYEGGIL
jgi:hypothetical protein